MNRGIREAARIWKDKEMDCPLKPPEGTSSAHTLTFAP